MLNQGSPALLESKVAPSKYDSLVTAMEIARRNTSKELGDGDPDPYGYAQDIENEHGIDMLPIEWKATPDDSRWNKRKNARARRAQVARYYLGGMPPTAIAIKLKVHEMTIYRDMAALEQEWRQSALADIEVLAAKDLARLDMMLSKIWAKVEHGDVKAVHEAVEIIKERGAILGYHQGVQVDIEQLIREVATANGFDPEKAVTIAQRISINFKP